MIDYSRHQAAPGRAAHVSGGWPRLRRALAGCAAVMSATVLAACGGSSVSDAVPKSTPEITPPTNTAAEKAAVQTTSTSATSTTKTTGTTAEAPTGTTGGETPKSESGTGTPSEATPGAGTGGGTPSAGEKEKEATKEAPKETGSPSPTGGASAP